MIQNVETNKSKYAFMIKEIKNLLIERNSCITHIVCSKNNASNFLANFGRSRCRTVVWLGSGPEELLDIASVIVILGRLSNTSFILQKKCTHRNFRTNYEVGKNALLRCKLPSLFFLITPPPTS